MQKEDKNYRYFDDGHNHHGYHTHKEHYYKYGYDVPHWVKTHEDLKKLYKEGLWGDIFNNE